MGNILIEKTDKLFKALGYEVGNVERWVHQCKRKFDLFGIIDRIAISDQDTVGIQVCKADFSAHDKKIKAS